MSASDRTLFGPGRRHKSIRSQQSAAHMQNLSLLLAADDIQSHAVHLIASYASRPSVADGDNAINALLYAVR